MDKSLFINLAILLLRVGLGVIFTAHGMQKLFGSFEGPGIHGVGEMLTGLGLSHPLLWAWVLSLTEFVGGLFLILGILPRISAALIGIVMIVAILKIHASKGFFASTGGIEFQLLILLVCISIVLIGGGKYSFFDKF
jgi:putative oxidoreductase